MKHPNDKFTMEYLVELTKETCYTCQSCASRKDGDTKQCLSGCDIPSATIDRLKAFAENARVVLNKTQFKKGKSDAKT